MDGLSILLIRLGYDIQEIGAFAKSDLIQPGFFFTDEEVANIKSVNHSISRMAGYFSAKEAFYKAVDLPFLWYWPDAEIIYGDRGRPLFRFSKHIHEYLEFNNIEIDLAISHSGSYAAATVIVFTG